MLDTSKLNRRHKAVLFITMLGVGTGLMAGESIEIAIGLAFGGAALAWAVGSNSRIVHGAFVAAGVLLFCSGLIWNWKDYRSEVRYYKRQVAQFEKQIPALAYCYPLLPASTADWFVGIGAANVKAMTHDPNFRKLPPAYKRTVLYKIYPDFRRLSPTDQQAVVVQLHPPRFNPDCSQYDPNRENPWSVVRVNPKSPSPPPTDLRLTAPLLAKAIKTAYTESKDIPDRQLVGKFTETYPAWKSAVVENVSYPPHPKWFKDAIAANVNPEAVPEDEKPGDPPKFDWEATEFFGLASLPMLASGLSLTFGVKPRPLPESDSLK